MRKERGRFRAIYRKREAAGDNRGVTLVEVIVGIAVLAIVGGGITSIILTSLRQYQNQSSEVNIQYEAQTAQNRIQNLVIDARCGVYLAGTGYAESRDESDPDRVIRTCSAAPAQLYIYDYEETAGITKKVLIRITFDGTKKWLVYDRYYYDEVSGGWVAESTGECFATYITDFSVQTKEEITKEREADGTEVEQARLKTVEITVGYQMDARTYTSNNVITLRNPVIVSNDVDKLYANLSAP